MKLNHPVDIHIKDFFLEGTFDFIKPGQTKEWILQNFPEPDDESDMGNNLSIWRYGCIEFHFDHDKLYLIWCDNLSDLRSNKSLKLDKWILDNLKELNLPYVQSKLNSENANYSVNFDKKLNNVIFRIKKSRVKLWFECDEEKAEDPNNFRLVAFGLSDPDYDSTNY